PSVRRTLSVSLHPPPTTAVYTLSLHDALPIFKVQALTESLATSESTIRRDLAQLEAEHLLRRVHGGAERVEQKNFELTMTEKESKHMKEKRAIASYAASLICEDDCIFIDAGTTTLQLIEALPQ